LGFCGISVWGAADLDCDGGAVGLGVLWEWGY